MSPCRNCASVEGSSLLAVDQVPGGKEALRLAAQIADTPKQVSAPPAKPEGTDNPIKGVKPIRDKDGKITGWRAPTPDGKGTRKSLDWGKQNGLDPNNFRSAAKVGFWAGAAGAVAACFGSGACEVGALAGL